MPEKVYFLLPEDVQAREGESRMDVLRRLRAREPAPSILMSEEAARLAQQKGINIEDEEANPKVYLFKEEVEHKLKELGVTALLTIPSMYSTSEALHKTLELMGGLPVTKGASRESIWIPRNAPKITGAVILVGMAPEPVGFMNPVVYGSNVDLWVNYSTGIYDLPVIQWGLKQAGFIPKPEHFEAYRSILADVNAIKIYEESAKWQQEAIIEKIAEVLTRDYGQEHPTFRRVEVAALLLQRLAVSYGMSAQESAAELAARGVTVPPELLRGIPPPPRRELTERQALALQRRLEHLSQALAALTWEQRLMGLGERLELERDSIRRKLLGARLAGQRDWSVDPPVDNMALRVKMRMRSVVGGVDP